MIITNKKAERLYILLNQCLKELSVFRAHANPRLDVNLRNDPMGIDNAIVLAEDLYFMLIDIKKIVNKTSLNKEELWRS